MTMSLTTSKTAPTTPQQYRQPKTYNPTITFSLWTCTSEHCQRHYSCMACNLQLETHIMHLMYCICVYMCECVHEHVCVWIVGLRLKNFCCIHTYIMERIEQTRNCDETSENQRMAQQHRMRYKTEQQLQCTGTHTNTDTNAHTQFQTANAWKSYISSNLDRRF